MKKTVKAFAVVFAMLISGCGIVMDDFAWIDSRHSAYYKQRGFEPQGYHGYNIWTIGRCYWYTLRRGEVTYESCLLKWGNEIHEYSLRAVDAITGTSGR